MKKFYLLPFLVFAFFSCEKEEIISEVEIQEAISTTKIKTALSVLQSTRQDKRSKSQKGTVIAQMELMGYEEIKNSKEKLLVIPAFLEGNSGESRILMLNFENETRAIIFTMYRDEESQDEHFSGRIGITDLGRNFLVGYMVENGVFISKFIPTMNKSKLRSSDPCETYVEGSDWDCGELDEAYVTDNSPKYILLREMYPDDAGETGSETGWDYGGGGSSSTSSDSEEAVKVENEIDNPCAKNVFNQLLLLSMNYDLPEIVDNNPDLGSLQFSQAILNMFNDAKEFDYIVNNTLFRDPTVSASTQSRPYFNTTTGNYEITTNFNTDYLNNATRLSIARTMVHESIHAYLVFMTRNEPAGNVRDALNTYATNNGYPINNLGFIHHNFMSQFVNSIAYYLYLWDGNHGTGGNLGWEYYHDMAWGGLANYRDPNDDTKILFYDEFKEYLRSLDDPATTKDESIDVKERILNAIENEAKNNSNAYGDECP